MVGRETGQQAGVRTAREVVLLLPEVTGWIVEAPVRAERLERRHLLVLEKRPRARVQAAGEVVPPRPDPGDHGSHAAITSRPVSVSAKTWMAGLSGSRSAVSGCSRGTGTRSRQIAGP